MRLLMGAAALALAFAAQAFAQTPPAPQCAFAPAPTLIDGATSNRDAMTAAGEEVNAWLQTRQAQEAACQPQLNASLAQLQTMESAYNAAGRERVAVVEAWNRFTQSSGGASALPLAATAPAANPTPACTFDAVLAWLYERAPAQSERAARNTELDAWRATRERQEGACQQEIVALRGSVDAGVSAFNASNQERVTVVAAWNAEVQEFGSSAAPAARRRERGGVLTRTDE